MFNFNISVEGQKRNYLITALGCGSFILLTGIAMLFYPGGIETNPNTEGYSFFYNFFSDLGRTQAINGESNSISFGLFTFAAIFAGFGLIPYFITIYPVIRESEAHPFWGKIGLIMAIPVASAYAVIGMTPCNEYLLYHGIAVGIAFIGSVFVLFFYLLAIRKLKSFPSILKQGYIVLLLICFAYVLTTILSVMYSSADTQLRINVVGQKICVYAEMLWGVFEGFGSRKSLIKS